MAAEAEPSFAGWQERTAAPAGSLPGWTRLALVFVIAAGAALRIIEPGTTVFCDDQARACALAQDVAEGRWETGGLINSGGFRNPPGFIYLLAAVWRVCPDPRALLWFTMLVNLLALVAAGCLCYRWVGSTATWWGLAFLAATPWAIHYCRWTWAQHLLFPAALCVYAALWAWLCRGRPWAACGVVLGLALVTQIHLAGGVLVLAVVLLVLLWHVRPPVAPVVVGAVIALLSFAPYLAARHVRMPPENRVGYRHVWRTVPAAAMSVSGLNWSLEFRGGYPHFAAHLAWRRWPFEIVMAAPVLLLVGGIVLARGQLRRREQTAGVVADGDCGRPCGRVTLRPLSLVVSLALLIPPAFVLLAIRTSPSYMTLWYPLPFAIMGFGIERLLRWRPGRRWRGLLSALLLFVLLTELGFFTSQLHHLASHGGVPGSPLSRSWGGLDADLGQMARSVPVEEVWVQFDGESPIMDEATAYLFRRAAWAGSAPGRALIHYVPPWEGSWWWEEVPVAPPGAGRAFQVRPWHGRQQRDGRVLHVPEGPARTQ